MTSQSDSISAAAAGAAAAGAAAAGAAGGSSTSTIETPAAAMQAVAEAREVADDRAIVRWFVIGWVAAGAMMLLLLARPDIQRTQEARVLGTAREMLERGGDSRDLLVPHLNGKPRLQKPPLAYWLTAASFATLGVNDFTGRLPAALAAWLTVGASFLVARRRFGDRAAAFAAAALFGSILFIRYGALAETDIWTALFTMIAVGAIWRCLDDSQMPLARFALWAHLSAVAIALTIMAKGAPAVFPVLFLVAAAAVRLNWIVLARWVLVGAPLTVLLIAAPWFLYIRTVPGAAEILRRELQVLAEGGGHQGSFIVYFGDVLVGTAPWTGIMVLAVADAFRRFRRDPQIAIALVWFATVFVPLCVANQKQKHYLMPALPPLAIMTGWILDRAIRWSRGDEADEHGGTEADELAVDPLVRAVKPALVLTWCAAALSVVAMPVAGHMLRQRFVPLYDVPLGAAIALAAMIALWLMYRRGLRASAAALAVAAFPGVALTLLYWSPTTQVQTYRDVAATMRRDERDAGGASFRYGFYAQPENLPLCWAIRRVIPSFFTPQEIDAALAVEPKPVLLTSSPKLTAPLPADYIERHRFEVDDKPVAIHVPKSHPAR